jgi:predicted dehydrogenase
MTRTMAENDRALRWGILGTGAMAGAFARGLADLPGAEAVAVGSRDGGRAGEFARGLGIARSHGSYEDLAADPGVDIVYIASTNALHRDHALLCLDAGKPVLVEKPFALNATQAREVVERARQRGLFCMEAMWTRFLPLMGRLRGLVGEGAVGRVQSLSAQMGYPFVYEPGGRQFDPALGGGALLDVGVYLVSLAFDLLGAPDEVVGRCSKAATGVDDRFAALFVYSDGRLATLSASLVGATSNDAVVAGSEGLIRVHEPFYKADRLALRRVAPLRAGGGDGRASGIGGNALVRTAKRRVGRLVRALAGRRERVVVPYVGDGYHYQAAEAARCLRAGLVESPTMPPDQTVAILEVMDRLRASWGVRYPGERE